MDHEYVRGIQDLEEDRIVDALQKVQFMHPHQSVHSAVDAASQQAGFCSGAGTRALAWLRLKPDSPIGRLRRTEILQLARSIRRFWRQNAAATEPATPPRP